jgi:uncharacterized protein (TIGR02145 family)
VNISCEKEIKLNDNEFYDNRDNKIYRTIQIGEQLWMAENLAYIPEISSADYGSDDDPYYYVYDYSGTKLSSAKETQNYLSYGVLYNWQAARISCPEGWHLPKDEEWKALEKYLGMSPSDAEITGWRSSGDTGKKLKSESGWNVRGNEYNSSGFSALPGGYRMSGDFASLGEQATFWSASKAGITEIWARFLDSSHSGVSRENTYRGFGFSVRCIED